MRKEFSTWLTFLGEREEHINILEVFLKGQHFGTILWRRNKNLQHMPEKNAPFTIFILGENRFSSIFVLQKNALLHVGCSWFNFWVKGAHGRLRRDMKETRTAILSMSWEGFTRTGDEWNESGISFKQQNFHVELLQFAKSAVNMNFNLSQK